MTDPNPTYLENQKPGTSEWQLSNPTWSHWQEDGQQDRAASIEGYAALTSVNRGADIALFVNTTDSTYTIEIFRMGWYQGLGARKVLGPIARSGTVQNAPTLDLATGLVECDWVDPYVLAIPNDPTDPTDWCSGIYLAKLTALNSGGQSYIRFTVRDDSRLSAYLFQTSVNTEQAYNLYGGESLYHSFIARALGLARKVSFNRPDIADENPTPEFLDTGAEQFFYMFEYNMVRFLERESYDVTYCTDVDTHENGDLLLSHRAFLCVGHDEYWSWQMRSNVESARDQGVGLGFFCANSCFWQVRFESSPVTGAPNRTIVCYKGSAPAEDPMYGSVLTTVNWRDPPVNLPEDALLGVAFGSGGIKGHPNIYDLVVYDASHWVYEGTGLQNGDLLKGILGYETDRMYGNAPPNTELVARSPTEAGEVADMTVYQASSGATVFAAGSIHWSWGLDDFNADPAVGPVLRTSILDDRAVQMTRNVLARLAQWAELTIDLGFNGFDDTDRLFAACGNTVYWQSGGMLRRGVISVPTPSSNVLGDLVIDLRFDGFDDPPIDQLFAACGNTIYWQSGNKFRRGIISVPSPSSNFYGDLKIDLRFDGFDDTDRLFAACGNTVYWQSGKKFRRGRISVPPDGSNFYGTLEIDLRFDGFDENDRLFAACGNTIYWQSGRQFRRGTISVPSPSSNFYGNLEVDTRFDGFGPGADGVVKRLFAACGSSVYWQAGTQLRRGLIL